MSRNKGRSSILCGICPDKQCRSKLYFPHFDTSIECTHCGQRHDRTSLQNVQEMSDLDSRLTDMIRNILMSNIIPKRGAETVKVLGLSNYHCKLLSPLLTKYGMNKRTGKAQLLTEMNQGDIFDCSLFGDRAFLIDPEHISVPGFGRDVSGSMNYLSKTLDLIKSFNDGEERLVPIHADGDGHCLVHAVSRALVGRELFWHPLRCSLRKHFEDKLETYKELFKDFVDDCEWSHIIDECDPDFVPPEGELLGLRNIHVFGLANVLKRPIILLDSLECMRRLGDYAALFLPSLVSPELCRGKNGRLNKPLCIAWSSPGHNHYIPLVGIKKKPLPILTIEMLPKAWGVSQTQIFNYIEFDENNNCTIGGNRTLGDPYILRLVSAMEELFLEKYCVHPALVADVHHYLYQCTGVVGADRSMVVQNTKKAVDESRLYRCLECDAICEQVIKAEWFRAGGVLYNMATLQYGAFVPNKLYPFPLHGIVCRYDPVRNELKPDLNLSCLEKCTWCNSDSVRKVRADGSVVYRNGDKTKTPSLSVDCGCGYKHYWSGKEYDNLPKKLNVLLDWNNKVVKDTVTWFENECDPSLNSNVFQVASDVVQKHFPGEFGSERLVQRVVEQLLNQTKQPESLSSVPLPDDEDQMLTESMSPKKIIISGTGVLHKEDLGVSGTEREMLQRIQDRAPFFQSKHSHENVESATKDTQVNTDDSYEPEKITVDDTLVTPAKGDGQSDKYVRVATSDGRQARLVLGDAGVTYNELQSWICSEFKIPFGRQKVKYGFPPQELQPGSGERRLPLSHGDRIIVETIPDLTSIPDEPSSDGFSSFKDNEGLSSPIGNSSSEKWDPLFENYQGNDPLEIQLLIVTIAANISNQSLWNYVKKRPSLFERGGLFYMHVARDIGLKNKIHCNLKAFPSKRFFYNAQRDALELCLEPCGHFPIHEGMDDDIKKALKPGKKLGEYATSSAQSHLFNSLGAGYETGSLSTVQEPQEKPEVGVAVESNEKITLPAHNLIRKGPGYSVLSAAEPSPEAQVGLLQSLANKLTENSDKGSACDSSCSTLLCSPSPLDDSANLATEMSQSTPLRRNASFTSMNRSEDASSKQEVVHQSSELKDETSDVKEETSFCTVSLVAGARDAAACDNSEMDVD